MHCIFRLFIPIVYDYNITIDEVVKSKQQNFIKV